MGRHKDLPPRHEIQQLRVDEKHAKSEDFCETNTWKHAFPKPICKTYKNIDAIRIAARSTCVLYLYKIQLFDGNLLPDASVPFSKLAANPLSKLSLALGSKLRNQEGHNGNGFFPDIFQYFQVLGPRNFTATLFLKQPKKFVAESSWMVFYFFLASIEKLKSYTTQGSSNIELVLFVVFCHLLRT